MVFPDPQMRRGVPMEHMIWGANYAAAKRPKRIVLIGDVYDMPSCSSYDKAGSHAAEGRRIRADLDYPFRVLEKMANIWARVRGWNPEVHVTLGNHEDRLLRAVRDDARFEGVFGVESFRFGDLGWKVHPFLKPVVLDGVSYCHYFPQNHAGKVVQTRRGAPTARAQVLRQMCSCTSGHLQGLDTHIHPTTNGFRRGVIAGSFYQHNEEYLSPGGNNYWRGIIMKHDVYGGEYDLCEVSMGYLKRKFK